MEKPAVNAPASGPTITASAGIAARRVKVAKLYVEEGRTIAEIERELGSTMVWKDLRALGIRARPAHARPQYPSPPTDRPCAHCREPLTFRYPSDAVDNKHQRKGVYCSSECAAEGLRLHTRLADVRYKQPKAELEAYKRQHGLRDYEETAAEIGCAVTTLQRWLRDRRLVLDGRQVPTQRYPGAWAGNRPVLFPEEAIEAGRRLLADAFRGRGERMTAKWADGRVTGPPRTGEERLCACGCGRLVYRNQHQLADGRERVFYDASCRSRYRWRKGIGVRELVENWWGKAGKARQIWLGRWEGSKPPAPGARPRGRPAVHVTPEQRSEIERLAALGWGRRAIRNRLFVSEKAVRHVLDELHRLGPP